MKEIFSELNYYLFSSIINSKNYNLLSLLQLKAQTIPIKKQGIFYLMLILILFSTNKAESANYYFSSISGNDSRTLTEAKNSATPWKTTTKLNSYMNSLQPGDSILFKRGEVFYGSISITKSGTAGLPIVFAAYGTGAKPEISGLSTLTGWISKGTNLWEADCPLGGSSVKNLLLNNVPQQIGRYPNVSDSNKGYLNFESHISNTQITDYQLSSSPNWTGAEMVIRKNHWVIDRTNITQHSGNTINYSGGSGYSGVNGWGYFIQNSPNTLDKYGEWYYNPSTKKMLIYTNTQNPGTSVEISSINTIISINGPKYITLKNLVIEGSNTVSIYISNAQYININNCTINASAINGIEASNCSQITFDNNTVSNTKNNALFFYQSCSYSSISNNYIVNTGYMAGAGESGDGSYDAINVEGGNITIEKNTIDSTGYVPIGFRGDAAIVRNNIVKNYCYIKDDGGGIYGGGSGYGCDQVFVQKMSYVTDNMVLNGIGAPEGTNNDYDATHGIYLDDNASNVEITGNTTANIRTSGLFLHNAHEIKITGNTVFNCRMQFLIQFNNCTYGKVRNINFNNNILFSRTSAQQVINFQSTDNDVNSFGSFNYNSYCRPLNENSALAIYYNNYNLSQWQNMYGQDLNTKVTPTYLTNTDGAIRFEYNDTKSPIVVSLNDRYIDVNNNSYIGSVTLQPYTSKILLKKSITTEMATVEPKKIDVRIYPNPVTDNFTILFNNPTEEIVHYELINIHGQKCLVDDLPIGSVSKQVNLDTTPNGMYVLTLKGKNNSTTQKVIVDR